MGPTNEQQGDGPMPSSNQARQTTGASQNMRSDATMIPASQQLPSQRTVALWNEVANGIDKSQTGETLHRHQ